MKIIKTIKKVSFCMYLSNFIVCQLFWNFMFSSRKPVEGVSSRSKGLPNRNWKIEKEDMNEDIKLFYTSMSRNIKKFKVCN